MKIFLFHRINPERDPLWDPIDPEVFEKQIRYLKKKYHLVLLEDYLLNKKHFNKRHHKVASIVFDDGYKDFLEYAYPILKKYEIPASMYLVTQSIDENTPIWTYTVDYLFQHTKINTLNFQKGKNLGFSDLVWSTNSERLNFAKLFKPQLKGLEDKKRRLIIEDLLINFSDVTLPQNLYLSWDDIRQLKIDGVEFGSHTVSHPMLGNIKDINVLKHELSYSRLRIKDELGSFPKTISYPIGSYNELVKKEAENAGYRLGLVVNQEVYTPDENSVFEIPRIEFYNESMFKTKLRANEIVTKIKRAIRK
tara:strand:+ start:620 stop:1540 length:921 start_codon:yes stop_codon:yes gene_type:complete